MNSARRSGLTWAEFLATDKPKSAARRGFSGTTYTGIVYWPLDPRAEEISTLDIAQSLAMQCRFNGHISRFCSVAEHSINVSLNVPPRLALEGLLHDAAETWLGDIIRPVKHMPEFLALYKPLEDAWEKVVAAKYRLAYPFPPEIKAADEAVVTAEIRHLRYASTASDLHDGSVEADIEIHGWMPDVARVKFLERFAQLFPR